jgi:hypothetical protein
MLPLTCSGSGNVRAYKHRHFEFPRRVETDCLQNCCAQVGSAVLLQFLVGPLTILAGIRYRFSRLVSFFSSGCSLLHLFTGRRHAGYQLVQPFRGGPVFVSAQAFGWSVYGFSSFVSIAALVNVNDSSHITGEYTTLGFLGFGAQAVLNFSLDFFRTEEDTASSRQVQPSSYRRGWLLWNNTATVASLCISVLSVSLSLACDCWRQHPMSSIAVYLLIGGNTLAAALTHTANGLEGYANWMPFAGGFEFVLLQAFGWFLLALFYQCALFLPAWNDPGYSHLLLLPHSIVGCVGLTGNLLLSLSLARFEANPDKISLAKEWSPALLAFNREAVYSPSLSLFFGILFTLWSGQGV